MGYATKRNSEEDVMTQRYDEYGYKDPKGLYDEYGYKIEKIKSEREKLGLSREEYGDLVQKDMNKEIATRYKEYDRAGFPKFTQSVEEGDPSYLALFGDIMSAPGRVLRADLMTPENTTEEFLSRMAEVEPTSEGMPGKITEGILQSPSLPALVATAPISMPMLMGTGAAGGIADVAYSKEDPEFKDYAMSGGFGAAMGPLGKLGGKALTEVGKKVLPSAKNILTQGTETLASKSVPGTKGLDKFTDIDKGLEAQIVNVFNKVRKDLKRSAREGIEIEAEKSKFINDAVKDGIQVAIRRYLGMKPSNIGEVAERAYDVGTRPLAAELGQVMTGNKTVEEMYKENPDWLFE